MAGIFSFLHSIGGNFDWNTTSSSSSSSCHDHHHHHRYHHLNYGIYIVEIFDKSYHAHVSHVTLTSLISPNHGYLILPVHPIKRPITTQINHPSTYNQPPRPPHNHPYLWQPLLFTIYHGFVGEVFNKESHRLLDQPWWGVDVEGVVVRYEGSCSTLNKKDGWHFVQFGHQILFVFEHSTILVAIFHSNCARHWSFPVSYGCSPGDGIECRAHLQSTSIGTGAFFFGGRTVFMAIETYRGRISTFKMGSSRQPLKCIPIPLYRATSGHFINKICQRIGWWISGQKK